MAAAGTNLEPNICIYICWGTLPVQPRNTVRLVDRSSPLQSKLGALFVTLTRRVQGSSPCADTANHVRQRVRQTDPTRYQVRTQLTGGRSSAHPFSPRGARVILTRGLQATRNLDEKSPAARSSITLPALEQHRQTSTAPTTVCWRKQALSLHTGALKLAEALRLVHKILIPNERG